MTHPVVTAVEWLGPEEAVLVVGDGQHTCRAFAHPFQGTTGGHLRSPLLGFNVGDVWKVTQRDCEVGFRWAGGFEYEVTGTVVSSSEPSVRVGLFVVCLDCSLPGDINTGDVVTFRAKRLDYLG